MLWSEEEGEEEIMNTKKKKKKMGTPMWISVIESKIEMYNGYWDQLTQMLNRH